MTNNPTPRILFSDLDISIVNLLNKAAYAGAQSLLREKLEQTTHSGEKVMLLSRLLAVLAIEASTASLTQIPEITSQMLTEVSLTQEERAILERAFKPLLESKVPQPIFLHFPSPPDSLRERLGSLPLYENRLEILQTTDNNHDSWIRLKGSRPILKEIEVELFFKRIITSALMAPDGANITDELEKHHHILESAILHNDAIIKDFIIDSNGNYSLSLKDIFQKGVLQNELAKYLGSQIVLDEREASGMAGYEINSASEYIIKEVATNSLGFAGHPSTLDNNPSEATADFRKKGYQIAHLHTHPDITFFSFTDITLDEACGIESDLAAYLTLNQNSDIKMAGIVLIGYQTGFIYQPDDGVRILKIV